MGEHDRALTEAQIEELLHSLPEWQVVEREGVQRLERSFSFRDFAQALDFVNRVGGLAEAENHHPAVLLTWGRVTVSWWTHSVGGLHRKDFAMAARTDTLA
jgi:4a-hydroxytetrahydrobiopterin dehydratase